MNNINPLPSFLKAYLYSTSSSEEEDSPILSSQDANGETSNLTEEISSKENGKEEFDRAISQVVQLTTVRFKEACNSKKRLTLKEATTLIHEITRGKIVHHISSLDILFVELMKVLQQFRQNVPLSTFKGEVLIFGSGIRLKEVVNGGQLLEKILTQFHLLFRCLCEYSILFEGVNAQEKNKLKISQSQSIYLNLSGIYARLESIITQHGNPEAKYHLHRLKEFLDLLYYLCHN